MTTSIHISLPESLKEYIQERCTTGDFSNPSDFIRALVREDKERSAKAKIEALLLEGLESVQQEGSIPVDKRFFDRMVADAVEQHNKRP